MSPQQQLAGLTHGAYVQLRAVVGMGLEGGARGGERGGK